MLSRSVYEGSTPPRFADDHHALVCGMVAGAVAITFESSQVDFLTDGDGNYLAIFALHVGGREYRLHVDAKEVSTDPQTELKGH